MTGLFDLMREAEARQAQSAMSHQGAPRGVTGRQMADAAQTMGLLTAPIPVVGDVMGLLGDAAMYATKPEERTWSNYGLTALGALPFVPGAVGNAIKKATRWEKVPVEEAFSNLDNADDFLYHVTSEPNAQKIIKQGLKPRTGRGTISGGSYDQYSQGKAFLTDRNGVSFWQGKVEDHLFDQFDDPPPVAVLRIPRSAATNLVDDALGSKDARAAAYYVTKALK